jgi:tRNA modification GTPase
MAEELRESIAAIATAPGAGALAVVRVSGPDAVAIGDRVFRGTSGLASSGGYTVHHGSIVGAGDERFDEVLVTVFRAPRSYTGEDMIEISCHGGPFVTREVVRVVLEAGARPALPGEFTRRAFLSGRIDLSQAEAVADVIASRSRRGHRASLEQLAGRLGNVVRDLRSEIMELCALLELELDFNEEGLDVITMQDVDRRIVLVRARIDALLASYAHGRIYRDGVSVVLAGEPNAGKSSVFNALLRQDRAIVTPVPGTTRDALEESIIIDGVLFRLTDTAGLRETTDQVERLGVQRSRDAVSGADIVLHVMDASVSADVHEHLKRMSMHGDEQHFIPVLNKCDLLPVWPSVAMTAEPGSVVVGTVAVSARTGQGLDALRMRLAQTAAGDAALGSEEVCITNERHRDALERAHVALERASSGVSSGTTEEYLAFDIREAAAALAEITGEVTSEEVLNHIFERFCIGK